MMIALAIWVLINIAFFVALYFKPLREHHDSIVRFSDWGKA